MQGLRTQALSADHAGELMLGADVVVVQADRFIARELEHALQVLVIALVRWSPPEMTRTTAARARLRDRGPRRGLAEGRDDRTTDLLGVEAELLEKRRHAPLAHQAEQEMLGADGAVAEPLRFVVGMIDDLFELGREPDLGPIGFRTAAAELRFDGGANLPEIDAERVEDPSRDALAFAHEAEEEMLRPDLLVVETDGLVLGEREHALRAVVEPIERAHR